MTTVTADPLYERIMDFITYFQLILNYSISYYTYIKNIDFDKIDEEHYILMPINYLLYNYDFDGIYNIGANQANRGSVKYFFNGKHPSRGFSSDYKVKPGPLKGNLIFKGKFVI